ncbi:hypothetical protein Tco_1000704 [Tanacetum coccineum]
MATSAVVTAKRILVRGGGGGAVDAAVVLAPGGGGDGAWGGESDRSGENSLENFSGGGGGRRWCMTRNSTKELLLPLENPERVLRSRRKLFDNPSLVELNPPEDNQLFEIEDHIEEEVTE